MDDKKPSNRKIGLRHKRTDRMNNVVYVDFKKKKEVASLGKKEENESDNIS